MRSTGVREEVLIALLAGEACSAARGQICIHLHCGRMQVALQFSGMYPYAVSHNNKKTIYIHLHCGSPQVRIRMRLATTTKNIYIHLHCGRMQVALQFSGTYPYAFCHSNY
jgi:hypothetical protein